MEYWPELGDDMSRWIQRAEQCITISLITILEKTRVLLEEFLNLQREANAYICQGLAARFSTATSNFKQSSTRQGGKGKLSAAGDGSC